MSPSPRENAEVALVEDERRPLTVQGHHEWHESLAAPARDFDEIDELMQLDPYAGDPPSKRSDRETDRLLSILDSLDERGNG